MPTDTRPPCKLTSDMRDANGCLPLSVFSALGDCRVELPEGEVLCFSTAMHMQDKHGHVVDGDHDPEGKNGCNHHETKEWKAEHHGHKVKHMEEQKPAETVATETVSMTPPPAPAVTTSTVSVDAAVAQTKELLGKDAGPGILIAGAAALAVVGAAIKIVPNYLKGKQELENKRIEVEQARSEKQDDNHQKCSAERMMLESKVAALQSKLDIVEAKAEKAGSASLNMDGFDPEELEERLAKIEKALKAKPKAKRS
jgi:hypothetical protein